MTDEFEKKRETRVVMVEAPSTSPDDEIDLTALFRLLIGAWKLIGGVAVLVTAAAVSYALLAPEFYKANTLLALVDEDQSSMSSTLGQFGGLAAMAGIPIPSDSNKEQVIATLKSRKFLGRFFSEKNLLPVLFEDQWDQAKGEWKIGLKDELPTEELAYLFFSENVISVAEDKNTGLVTLSISWKDPEIAAEWANDLVRRLNEELRQKAIEDSKKRIGYIEKELGKTMVKDMKEVLYSLLESEKQKAMLANVNEEFALEVIDPAVAPELRASPKRMQLAVLGVVCGLFLGVFAVFFREFLRKLRNPLQTESPA